MLNSIFAWMFSSFTNILYTLFAVALLILFIWFCFKYPAMGSKVFVTVLLVIAVGITTNSVLQLNYYYSAQGGIFGKMYELVVPNRVDASEFEYTIKDIELTQVGNSETYSASMIVTDIFELDGTKQYGLSINNDLCNNVQSASDFIQGDYVYNFYSEDNNLLISDALKISIAFYSNSTYISLSTNGGVDAVAYWNYYFNKNVFVIKIINTLYSPNNNFNYVEGDLSNYATMNLHYGGNNVNSLIIPVGTKIDDNFIQIYGLDVVSRYDYLHGLYYVGWSLDNVHVYNFKNYIFTSGTHDFYLISKGILEVTILLQDEMLLSSFNCNYELENYFTQFSAFYIDEDGERIYDYKIYDSYEFYTLEEKHYIVVDFGTNLRDINFSQKLNIQCDLCNSAQSLERQLDFSYDMFYWGNVGCYPVYVLCTSIS